MNDNNNISLPTELRSAVSAIKQAILQSQYKAAKMVNRERLSLYFGIGRYISEHSRKGYWGTGAIESISEQLQRELPGLRGFSGTSIKKMRQFYEEWCNVIRPPMAVESSVIANRPPTAVNSERQDDSLSGDGEIQVINNVSVDNISVANGCQIGCRGVREYDK